MASLVNKLTGKKSHKHSEGYTEQGYSGSATGYNEGGYNEPGYSEGVEGRERLEEAPVVRERVHDEFEHLDQTQKEEIRKKTDVKTRIQPVRDQQTVDEDNQVIDEGVEVHEVGSRQLDERARAELERRRQQVAESGGSVRTSEHREVDMRPEARASEERRTIEQVQPVIERDVYVPHKLEHKKADVTIVHEPAKFHTAEVAPAVTVDEYERMSRGQHHTAGTAARADRGSSSSSSDGRAF